MSGAPDNLVAMARDAGGRTWSELARAHFGLTVLQLEEMRYYDAETALWMPRGISLFRKPERLRVSRDRLQVDASR